MKLIRLVIKYIFLLFLIASCITDEPEGVFNLSEEAQKYKIDTTITNFQMIDNNGITEQFYLRNYNSYYHEPWENGFLEIYSIEYQSILNNYNFGLDLRADDISSTLNITWNYTDYLGYDFKDNEVYGEPAKPIVKFYESIKIKDTTYYDIIEIDYTKYLNKIDKKTPIKTFISGTKGLIKLVRKDGIILERKN